MRRAAKTRSRGSPICAHKQRQDVGGLDVREVGRRDFEPQLADCVGAGGEFVDDAAKAGRGGADGTDGSADHHAHHSFIESLEAAARERGESAGISSVTSPLRPETAIRARWDRP